MNYKDISGEELKKLREEQPDAVVVDVRTPMEVSQGKIPGAQVIDLMDAQFPQKVDALDKDKPYVLYCRSGNRSAQACNYMAGQGFTKLYNLNGGIGNWLYETE